MHRRPFHRWPFVLRAAALLAFALCLVTRPMVAAWGEMHEITMHADSAAGHSGHGASDLRSAAASDAEPGDLAHLLLHHAHCCGPSTGLIDTGQSLLLHSFLSVGPPLIATLAAMPKRIALPFRPPIS